MTHLIGLLHGHEETFPPALIEEINQRQAGCHAESIKIGAVRSSERPLYRVLVDRLSPRVPFFRKYLKHAALAGSVCLNDPFWSDNQDRLSLAHAARECGLETVATVLLPSRDHPGEVGAEDLGNLAFPLPWEEYLEEVGLPAVLRTLDLAGHHQLSVTSLAELWHAYGRTGQTLMCLQSQLKPEAHLLCLVAGDLCLPLGYDPVVREYRLQATFDEAILEQARESALAFARQSGAWLVGVEFTLQAGRLILTDLQLVPNLDWWSISEQAFTKVVGAVADLVLDRARTNTSEPKIAKKSGAKKAATAGR